MNSALPPPWIRWFRRRAAVVAAAFVFAVSGLSAQVSMSAHLEIEAQINAHWRGAYDLLVRPAGSKLNLESTNGLVEPNFLSFAGHGGISLDQLSAIRAIGDVGVAAPIAFIGNLAVDETIPEVYRSDIPTQLELDRATLTLYASDGRTRRPVQQSTFSVLLGPGSGDLATVVVSFPGNGDGDASGGIRILGRSPVPPLNAPVLAVDPVAERALLGSSGDFLAPLIELDRAWTAATFDLSKVLPGSGGQHSISILNHEGGSAANRPVFPLIVSKRAYSQVGASVAVQRQGDALPAGSIAVNGSSIDVLKKAAIAVGSGETPLGSTDTDLAGGLRPYGINGLTALWPGSAPPADQEADFHDATDFQARLATRPSYVSTAPRPGSSGPSFVIQPQGVVGPGGDADEGALGQRVTDSSPVNGREQSYRHFETLAIPVAEGFKDTPFGDVPYALAPVGEFDLNSLDLPRDPLDYVPYGAYDPPDTTLVADAAGNSVDPVAMTPTLNPLGLLQVPPLAITNLYAAVGLRGDAPIDAIRVRVAGISDYGPDALAKVERVAQAIIAMGLDVDVVAASSPQTVEVYVPQYNTDSDPATDLGWVQQHWTTLGAAPRVETGLSSTNLVLLLLTLASVALAVLGLQVIESAVRSREAAILGSLGWRRRQIVQWSVSEAAVAGVLVLVVGLLAWRVLGTDTVGLSVTLAAVLLFPLAALAAAVARRPQLGATQSGDRSDRLARLAPRPRGPRSYALRGVLARPVRSIAVVASLGLAATAVALGASLIAGVAVRVGPTLLAEALTQRLQLYQLALLGLDAVGAVAFTLLALRTDLADRRLELSVLTATAWSPGRIRQALRWERLWLAMPAAILAASATFLLAPSLAGDLVAPGVAAACAALLALSVVVWGPVAAWRLGRR